VGLGEGDLLEMGPYIHERTFSPGEMIIAVGLVRRQRGRIVVVDREGLEREAAGE
jgi:hypothetical protein